MSLVATSQNGENNFNDGGKFLYMTRLSLVLSFMGLLCRGKSAPRGEGTEGSPLLKGLQVRGECVHELFLKLCNMILKLRCFQRWRLYQLQKKN